MKHTVTGQSDTPHWSPAAASVASRSSTFASVAFTDNRPEAVAQRRLADTIHNSPSMVAQRRQLRSLFGETAQIMGGPEEEELLQKKVVPVQRRGPEDEELLQRKGLEEEEPLQGKFEGISSAQLKEETPKPNNTGLPDQLKAGIEGLSGLSMDNVKVHYNSSHTARLNALAYTQGADIHIAPGQEQHLLHEAWHVVQQAQGRVRPTMQLEEGVPVNDDDALEREADVMGALAALALNTGREPADSSVRQRKAVTKAGRSVAQLAAPGGIEHVTNSCFATALINTFTVVRPLRNLLIPTNNVLVGDNILCLHDLLWRAVNTVDRTKRVTRRWAHLIMASLAQNNIIPNALDTADFSNVLAGVIAALTPGGGQHGQGNNMPVSTGEIAWYPGQALGSARLSKTRWAHWCRAKSWILATEDFLQIVVEYASPSLQEEMRPFGRPLHLLSLDEAFADDLIDRRLHKRRTDGVALTMSLTEVRDECTVVANGGVEFGGASRVLCGGG